jgi:hypothetical protein
LELPIAIIGAGKSSVNSEIIASGIRPKCVAGRQRVAIAGTAPFGKPAPMLTA